MTELSLWFDDGGVKTAAASADSSVELPQPGGGSGCDGWGKMERRSWGIKGGHHESHSGSGGVGEGRSRAGDRGRRRFRG
jgi:hypothetical protein